MYVECAKYAGSSLASCMSLATVNFTAVHDGGFGPYKAAQEKACDRCCDKPYN